VEACPSASEFKRAPLGRCLAGRSWLYFYPHERLCGFVVWGKPTEADFEQLVQVLHVELDKPRHVSLVDARGVEGADPRGFRVLEEYVRANAAALGRVVEKLAVVRPGGLMGAVTAGFFGVAPQPYPVEYFDDRADAARWIGATSFLAELASAEERAAGQAPLLRDLRTHLEARLDDPSLASAAKVLGLSERTLQRKLGDQETTFQAEVNRARVRVAKRLLRETDAKLTQVALEVGCASLPSFSALFRRATGEAPSAYRAKYRA
jgi:AraC-like DNA-binding protein